MQKISTWLGLTIVYTFAFLLFFAFSMFFVHRSILMSVGYGVFMTIVCMLAGWLQKWLTARLKKRA